MVIKICVKNLNMKKVHGTVPKKLLKTCVQEEMNVNFLLKGEEQRLTNQMSVHSLSGREMKNMRQATYRKLLEL